MGYTHYWYRPREIAADKMLAIVADFSKVVLALDEAGVKLGDAHGVGVPIINEKEVRFNGLQNCGHKPDQRISIPWPAKGASGVNSSADPVAGSWFAGALLSTRSCDGDCSYETFDFPAKIRKRSFIQPHDRRKDLFFSCTKTAYRPYDLAVTAFLIIAKHHLPNDLIVSSDGEDEQWTDAKKLCEAHLGYGRNFTMLEELVAA